MMAIHSDSITSEFKLDELKALDIILSECQADFESNLSKKDSYKYIKLLQLRGKVSGLINLIENKKNSEVQTANYSHPRPLKRL